jgi:hypothetical protein
MMPISLAKSGSRGTAPQFRRDSQLWQKVCGITRKRPGRQLPTPIHATGSAAAQAINTAGALASAG